MRYARLAELADALDLGSSGRPWGFKSLVAHQKTLENKAFQGFYFYFVSILCPFVNFFALKYKTNCSKLQVLIIEILNFSGEFF